MANVLPNAGFLELASGWSKSTVLTLAVDESVRGEAGRAVLVGSGTTTSASQIVAINTAPASRGAVTANTLVEAFAHAVAFVNGVATAPRIRLLFFNSGGASTGAYDLTVSPAERSTYGEGLKGIRSTFRRGFLRQIAPVGSVTMGIELSVTPAASGSAVVLALLKPQAAPVPAGRTEPLAWGPGAHVDPGLTLPIWPSILRPFQSQPGGEPFGAVIEFQGDTGRPATRRTALDPARRLAGRIRCDEIQRAALEAFWRDRAGDFFVVEPDSDRLCVASWAADGQPRMSEARGPTVMMDVGLWLETA